MDLNNLEHMKEIDTQSYIDDLEGLPDQLAAAWELGSKQDLPEFPDGIDQVLIAGMGGSAIGGDLLAAYAETDCKVPVIVHREYTLPQWAFSKNTLVICSSYSGNTEETLAALDAAVEAGIQVMAVTTGGKLAEKAQALGFPLWQIERNFQPRAAVGFSFGLLMVALSRLGLDIALPDDIPAFIADIKADRERFRPQVPVSQNPAKRLAGQLVGRWVTIWGAGILAPVARRWKGQINEVAKSQAAFEVLPEGDHNTLQGITEPKDQIAMSMHIFLQADSNHPRDQLRSELTRKGFMMEGHGTDLVKARGKGRLAQMWNALLFGDYVAYYLAMAYGIDPSPVPKLAELKEQLKTA
ncbi:MAG: bifunctional phosphoglucose/phosphomannose isomerase [Anaerolineales bacterium]|jgi:glucose/mannose-6-phosphate isomerase